MAGASPPGHACPVRKPTVGKKHRTLQRTAEQPHGTTGASPGGPIPVAAPKGPSIRIAATAASSVQRASGSAHHPGMRKLESWFYAPPVFSITAEPKMPVIEATASIVGLTTGPDPTRWTEFEWTATVSFNSKNCPYGVVKKAHTFGKRVLKVGDTRTIPAITTGSQKVVGGKIVARFDQIRGGTLTISVTAKVGGITLKGETKGWRIQGTNPSKSEVGKALPDDTHRKIACAESTMEQFCRAKGEGNAWYPKFSGDTYLGIGICQLTDPRAEDDQVWDWRENVKAGVDLYDKKKEEASNYPGLVARSPKFLAAVRRYNELRLLENDSHVFAMPGTPAPAGGETAAGPVPVSVEVSVPEFTDDQLEDDTIRGFNGWGGHDAFGHSLHEFRIQQDPLTKDLVVDGDPNTGKVSAKWERVPVSARPGHGDPNYVRDVKNRDPKTCKVRRAVLGDFPAASGTTASA
jgi:hypothetical protein